jgi:predicted PurR-regulated permease PerM
LGKSRVGVNASFWLEACHEWQLYPWVAIKTKVAYTVKMGDQKKFEAKLMMQARYGSIAACVLGVLFLLYIARGALFPVVTGWFLAYLLNPIIDRMERRGISRGGAVAFLLGISLVFFSAMLILFLPYFGREIFRLFANLLKQSEALLAWIESMGVAIPSSFSETLETYGTKLREVAPDVASWVGDHIRGAFAQVGAFVGLLLNVLFIPLFAYYFLIDFHQADDRLLSFFPYGYRGKAREYLSKIDEVLSGFFYGQLLVGIAQGTLFAIGLTILGVEFSVVIGILAGLFSIVPYLGYAIGVVLSLLMALLALQSWGVMLGILGLFFLVNLLEGFYLTPKLVGDKVGLSPVMVIIALLFFSELLGLTGLVIAVPTTAVLRILWVDVEARYRESRWFQKGNSPFALPEQLVFIEQRLSAMPCLCGGAFTQQSAAPLELPLAGATLQLLCMDCGREQSLRFSTKITAPNPKAEPAAPDVAPIEPSVEARSPEATSGIEVTSTPKPPTA